MEWHFQSWEWGSYTKKGLFLVSNEKMRFLMNFDVFYNFTKITARTEVTILNFCI